MFVSIVRENHAMADIFFYNRKLLGSCVENKDCSGSKCCRDGQCTGECDTDDSGFPLMSLYLIPVVLFIMLCICSCVYKQSKKWKARAARRAAIRRTLQLNVQLYRMEVSRAREPVPERYVGPLENSVDSLERPADPPEHPFDPPAYSVDPPAYSVDLPGYSVHPPEYTVDSPHTSYRQPPSYFV